MPKPIQDTSEIKPGDILLRVPILPDGPDDTDVLVEVEAVYNPYTFRRKYLSGPDKGVSSPGFIEGGYHYFLDTEAEPEDMWV
jgi:hypothetical protein